MLSKTFKMLLPIILSLVMLLFQSVPSYSLNPQYNYYKTIPENKVEAYYATVHQLEQDWINNVAGDYWSFTEDILDLGIEISNDLDAVIDQAQVSRITSMRGLFQTRADEIMAYIQKADELLNTSPPYQALINNKNQLILELSHYNNQISELDNIVSDINHGDVLIAQSRIGRFLNFVANWGWIIDVASVPFHSYDLANSAITTGISIDTAESVMNLMQDASAIGLSLATGIPALMKISIALDVEQLSLLRGGLYGLALVGVSLTDHYLLRPYVWGAPDQFIDSSISAVEYAYHVRDILRNAVSNVIQTHASAESKFSAVNSLSNQQADIYAQFSDEVQSAYLKATWNEWHPYSFVFDDAPAKVARDAILAAVTAARADSELWLQRGRTEIQTTVANQATIATLQAQIEGELQNKQAQIKHNLNNSLSVAPYQVTVANAENVAWDVTQGTGFFKQSEPITVCFAKVYDGSAGTLQSYVLTIQAAVDGGWNKLEPTSFDSQTECGVYTVPVDGRYAFARLQAKVDGPSPYLDLGAILASDVQILTVDKASSGDPGSTGTAASHPLNDTGIQFCSNAEGCAVDTPCVANDPAGQDGFYGRDAAAMAGQLPKVGAGGVAFDFTKISNSGMALPPSAILGMGPNDWACTRDNVTGLTWEVKTSDKGLRDKDWTYTWYNSDPASNGGREGDSSGGSCYQSGHCDTEQYVADVNESRLCGYNDWRMPMVNELHGLVDNAHQMPLIDPSYFAACKSESYWSGSAQAFDPNNALSVDFARGNVQTGERIFDNYVRLVRYGQ